MEGILLSVRAAATNVVPGALARITAASGVQPEDVEMDRQEVRCSFDDRAGHGYGHGQTRIKNKTANKFSKGGSSGCITFNLIHTFKDSCTTEQRHRRYYTYEEEKLEKVNPSKCLTFN